MILGAGTTADAIRHNVGDVRFTWLAYDLELGQTDKLFDLARPHLRTLGFAEIVVISSQVRVGTCARLETEFPGLWFAVVPENLRAATATADFAHQDRIVVGARQFSHLEPLILTLGRFTDTILYMTPESAEFSKHALNGFLAVSVTYANEIAELATVYGADPEEVAAALMADSRIGEKAYLKPGPKIGPHLQREIDNLIDLGAGPIVKACQ